MKINISIELDEESTEILQAPFNNVAEQISTLLNMFDKVDYTIKDKGKKSLPVKTKKSPAKVKAKAKPAKKKSAKSKKAKVAKKVTTKKTAKSKKPKKAVAGTVLNTIKNSKKGINSEDLKKKTGFTTRQIADNVYRLKKKGAIKKSAKGLFVIA